MKLRNLFLAAAAVAVVPMLAQAQPVTGLYVGGGIGVNQLLDSKVRGTASTLSSDIGAVGLASVGYGYGNGLRTEIEASYRWGNGKVSPGGGSGDVQQAGVMVNMLYDFALGGPVTPYLGVGGGYQWQKLSGGGDASDPAVQGIAGIAYAIDKNLSLTLEGRYMRSISNVKFTNGAASMKTDALENVSGLIGLRYSFGAAPMMAAAPAAVAAPAAPVARTYLVFFDWDKSDLTARAKQIIAEAAAASPKVAATRIEVAGHADKTGTAPYNRALSLRRAQTVGSELVRLGVPEKSVFLTAFGDTQPLVPTAAGVREPQNRRVEIVLK